MQKEKKRVKEFVKIILACEMPWYKKWWVITIACVVVFFLVPFIINFAFKLPAISKCFIAEWDAGDVLAFYGSLLASIITIIALVVTIRFTNKMALNEYRKTIIEQEYEYLFKVINNVKSTVLLEDLDVKSIVDIFSGNRLNRWIDTLPECLKTLQYFHKLNNGNERNFIQNSALILQGMGELLLPLHELIEQAEKAAEDCKAEKAAFDLKQEEIKKSPEYQAQAMNFRLSGKKMPKLDSFNDEKPKTKNDIYNEIIDNLSNYIEQYKNDYISLFEKYIEDLKKHKSQEINRLFL